ncbi:hypothetical protein PF003_g32577 [Phytophthora fragariae]|nr:hypothetical protein PF003_g32577 [Phytophthora fragariae]
MNTSVGPTQIAFIFSSTWKRLSTRFWVSTPSSTSPTYSTTNASFGMVESQTTPRQTGVEIKSSL